MQSKDDLVSKEGPVAVGGGCLFAIPVIIGLGFKFMLNYAKSKEHQFAHQVEEVELEGEAAQLVEESMTPKESLERFVKKLKRITGQFEKMGGRFSPADFESEKRKLSALEKRVAADPNPDAGSKALLVEAQQCLQRYAPQ